MMKQFAWGVLPYIAFTFLIVGTIVRYTVFERNWTTKSSQFLTKGNLPLAGPMFHLGLVMALGGHVIGVLIPKAATEAVGINEHLYHMIALGGGTPAGILFFLGFILLLGRRFGTDRMAVNTSTMDRFLYFFLFLAIFTGCAATLMFRLHMLAWMSVAILFPFTRLVHCLSAPFEYLWRSPIIYRKK